MSAESAPERPPATFDSAVREFIAIVVKIWPIYVAVAVLTPVIALIAGKDLGHAVRLGAQFTAFAIWFGPLGWIRSNETDGGGRRLLLLLLCGVVWVALLFLPVLLLVLSWADP